MIPADCPPGTVSYAERALFEALKAGLPDPYVVLHSIPWLRPHATGPREGECDYLVFHPARGLLFLEAKTAVLGYDAAIA